MAETRATLLGARDRSSDTTVRGSNWRWTTTSRSADGMMQTDRTPTTSGDAPPKSEQGTSASGAILKLIAGIALYYYLTR